MHLRQPSIDRGVTSFLWAFGLGLYLWLGMLAIGVEGATAFIMSVLAACVIFLVVRLFGGDEIRKPRQEAQVAFWNEFLVAEGARGQPVIAGERAHQAARELAAERDLETLAGLRLRLGEPSQIGAVVDQTADGSPVIGRQDVHGTLSIVAAGPATNPWREGTTDAEAAETGSKLSSPSRR